MAWPSGTKASTANVDQGGDKISLARADIKQNIDNVNSIIDEFNISSPSDGDVLRYSSSSGKWEQVASTALSSVGVATLAMKTGIAYPNNGNLDSTDQLTPIEFDILADGNNIVIQNYDSAGYPFPDAGTDSAGVYDVLSFDAGHYEFKLIGGWPSSGGGQTIKTQIIFSENTNHVQKKLTFFDNGQIKESTAISTVMIYSAEPWVAAIGYYASNTNTAETAFTSSITDYGRIIITKLA